MGKAALSKYVCEVYKHLYSMNPDSFFSIEKNVKPENMDLFIKISCMFIHEQQMSSAPRNFNHTFNVDCSEIRCVKLHYSEKKTVTKVTL
jgi:hypothetical protein